jgi:hypothetical protein
MYVGRWAEKDRDKAYKKTPKRDGAVCWVRVDATKRGDERALFNHLLDGWGRSVSGLSLPRIPWHQFLPVSGGPWAK